MADAMIEVQEQEIVLPAIESSFNSHDRTMTDIKTFRIITAGDLTWEKGYEQALMTIRILVDRKIPVYFEIFGEGNEYQSIMFAIHDMDLSQNVQVNGRISPDELRNRFKEADVFFLSSVNEHSPLETLEAMGCGLPVIATNSDKIKEIITDGLEGLIVPIMDPKSAADALEMLWRKAELRSRMGASAKEKMLKQELE
ncbi:MAG TPA: glycosyltransferase family 4 protein, partial [Acidobacteriota bacterium]|jgi:colanic acid/amylovoran biosynthesis glycosyltransferase